jgi:cadmium resistance protein CadD (predicted permease)
MNLTEIDSGTYDGRKFILTLIGTLIITAYSVVAAFVPAMTGILPTFIGGILGMLGLYFGVNVANKFVMSKASTAQLGLQLKTANGQVVGAQKTAGDQEDIT